MPHSADNMESIIYPVSRLLANPRIFHAIADYLGGPDAETIRTAFYDLLEYEFTEVEPEQCSFDAEEACFRCHDDGAKFEIALDSGIMSVLEAIEGEMKSNITTDGEFAATSAIYQRLITAIEEADPALKGNIALCSPPTPANSYLRSSDGERFEGAFHLLSEPEKTYAFSVRVVDLDADRLEATIHPM